MLKIYNVFNLHGKIVLQDYIEFKYGRFETGIHGYGDVMGGAVSTPSKKVNYEYQSINNYVETTKKIVETNDGFVTNLFIWNPLSYEELEEKFKDIPKNAENYEKYCLNEDGILLFTNHINIKYKNDGLIQRVFGRYPETGMYLVKPGATLTMAPIESNNSETYEVLQSRNLGKQLVLSKLNRNIY